MCLFQTGGFSGEGILFSGLGVRGPFHSCLPSWADIQQVPRQVLQLFVNTLSVLAAFPVFYLSQLMLGTRPYNPQGEGRGNLS